MSNTQRRCPEGRGQCPKCGKCISIRPNGMLRAHGWTYSRHGYTAVNLGCSGQWPAGSERAGLPKVVLHVGDNSHVLIPEEE